MSELRERIMGALQRNYGDPRLGPEVWAEEADAVLAALGEVYVRCATCKGSGRVRFRNEVIPAERFALTRDTMQCEACAGVGFVRIGDAAAKTAGGGGE